MTIDNTISSKLIQVTNQRNVAYGLLAITVIIGISYGVYAYNNDRKSRKY